MIFGDLLTQIETGLWPVDRLEQAPEAFSRENVPSPSPEAPVVPVLGDRRFKAPLRQLAISTHNCNQCCIRARNNASSFVNNFANEIEALTQGFGWAGYTCVSSIGVLNEYEPFLFTFQVHPIVPPRLAPVTNPIAGGILSTLIVVKLVGDFGAARKYPEPAVSLLTQSLRAAAQAIRERTVDDCEGCCRERSWGQNAPEKKMSEYWRKKTRTRDAYRQKR